MTTRTVTFRILRYKPNRIDPPEFKEYVLEIEPETSILEGLEKIRLEQDSTLMYRHSCHHSSCGTCACKINDRERLTCITRIADLKDDTVTLTPLEGFKTLGDLVVDVSPFYQDYSADWSYLRQSEKIASTPRQEGIKDFSRFENCIECGACVSACPIACKDEVFLGPAVLAAVNNELKKAPQKSAELRSLAESRRGVLLCERSLDCSRVCPTRVYPARHIADLRKLLDKRK